jgi:hypothetical protein
MVATLDGMVEEIGWRCFRVLLLGATDRAIQLIGRFLVKAFHKDPAAVISQAHKD